MQPTRRAYVRDLGWVKHSVTKIVVFPQRLSPECFTPTQSRFGFFVNSFYWTASLGKQKFSPPLPLSSLLPLNHDTQFKYATALSNP